MASKWAQRPTRPLRLAEVTVKLTMPLVRSDPQRFGGIVNLFGILLNP
jgi:hypothetical protein